MEGGAPNQRNPQAEQMSDESMVRGLAAQALAIWPQESALFAGYGLADSARILDLGCGTGEITGRLARQFPAAEIVGVDIVEAHLDRGRREHRELGSRVRFERGDAFDLSFADDAFDLVVCRHLLQSVPEPGAVLAQMVRVARPGGRLHVLSEDYGLIHFHPVEPDTDTFWRDGPIAFGQATGTDLRFGRKTWSAMHALGLGRLEVHWIVVDTVRVPRETLRAIWVAWRDGYSDVIARNTRLTGEQVAAYWNTMIACLERPDGYAAWHIPVVTGLVG